MKKIRFASLKQLIAFILIFTLAAPYTTFAAEAKQVFDPKMQELQIYEPVLPEWSELSAIEPNGFDASMIPDIKISEKFDSPINVIPSVNINDFKMTDNELSELSPEIIEELMHVEVMTSDSHTQTIDALSELLNNGAAYASLTDGQRNFIFTSLDISDDAYDITGQLFTVMERDGFTLAESIVLILIMSGGLYDYVEARIIFKSEPFTVERYSEIMRFEQFAQIFDVITEVNEKRLVSNPFLSANGFDDTPAFEAKILPDLAPYLNAHQIDEEYSIFDASMDEKQTLPDTERMGKEISDYKTPFKIEEYPVEIEEQPIEPEEDPIAQPEDKYEMSGPDIGYQTDLGADFNPAMPEHLKQSIFEAFTNENAFAVARQMFLNNHSALEIETAFAIGAALQVEPQTFILERDANHVATKFPQEYYAREFAVNLFANAAIPHILEVLDASKEYPLPAAMDAMQPTQPKTNMPETFRFSDANVEEQISTLDADLYSSPVEMLIYVDTEAIIAATLIDNR